ncbi:hypothetical protein BS78_K251900 [Paspalum vaginatum]|uniref:Uncharacterized protein n=1 Tax=Paspalum vaginatum TaxID=158149 RepID=A0A9W7X7I8_9POAL|nr:hypothetical protein BS78_K251900 [Paspalum vaginatum]
MPIHRGGSKCLIISLSMSDHICYWTYEYDNWILSIGNGTDTSKPSRLIEKSLLVRYSFSVWKRRNGRDQLELQLLPSVQDEQRLSGVRPLLLLCISLAGRQETVLMC